MVDPSADLGLQIPRCSSYVVVAVGKGQFGEVFISRAFDVDASTPECLVMVKSLLFVEEPNQTEFYRQLDLFHRCQHPNVVRLLGLSREIYPTFAIYEFSDWVRDQRRAIWRLAVKKFYKFKG